MRKISKNCESDLKVSKKFFATKYAHMLCIIVMLIISALGAVFLVLTQKTKTAWVGIVFCFLVDLFFIFIVLFNCWKVKIDSSGIFFYNLFGLSKIKRFFYWNDISEIEIIKVLLIKRLYITRNQYVFERKLFLSIRNCDDVMILSGYNKRLFAEIKKTLCR